jgi:ribosomal protein S18 acetylase RimI-like enzyme
MAGLTYDIAQVESLVRRAPDLAQDYPALLRMQRLSWEVNFPDLAFDDQTFVHSLRASSQLGQIYIYEVESTLVGWLWLDTSTPRISGHVRHIQVAQPFWGRGLGKRLLQDAIALCIEAHCRAVTLNVTKSNQRAMALYRSLGFLKLRDDEDRQFMELPLEAGCGR